MVAKRIECFVCSSVNNKVRLPLDSHGNVNIVYALISAKLLSIMKNLAMLCKLAMISGYASVDSRFLLSISGWKVTVFLCFASVNMIVQRSYPMVRIYLLAVSL